MATLYAKSAGGNWTAAGTWSNTSSAGGDSSGPPTAADDCVIDSGSGNVTINAAASCRSLDCNGFTGTLTHNSGVTFSIGDATAGAGNIALRLVSGMTYTLGSNTTSNIQFISTSSTQQSVYCGSKLLGNVNFDGVGGSWILQDGLSQNQNVGATFTHSKGILNINGQTMDVGNFASNSGSTRTLTLGAANITCRALSGNAWNASSTGLTFTCGTSTITSVNGNTSFAGGNLTYYDVVLSASATVSITGDNTFHNLTRTGTASKTCRMNVSGDNTITNLLTITGNSATNRMLVLGGTSGTARTLTAASVSIESADFQDITGAGAASWNLASITGNSGDCGGNSGITFTTAATQTATGTASFTWSTHGWTSRVPLPQDDVVINNSFVAGRTVSMDMPRMGKSITFGCSGSPTFAISLACTLFGSLNLTGIGSITSSGAINFEGRSSHTVTSAGFSLPNAVNITCPSGTLTCQDAFASTSVITLNNGTFVDNGYSVTATAFSSSSSNTRALTISGTWTVTGTGTVWTTNAHSNMTVNATGSNIVVSNTSATQKTMQFGTTPTLTWDNVTITGDNVVISGSAIFNVINVNNAGQANGLKFTSATTNTVGDMTTNGSAGNLAIISATTSGSAFTLSKASGTIVLDYISLKDSTATGGATFHAGANSTDVSGNTGWLFTTPDTDIGGAECGSSAIVGQTYVETCSGGIVCGSTAEPSLTINETCSGGVVIAGTTEVAGNVYDEVGEGGIVIGSTAEPSVSMFEIGSGGIVLGSSATCSMVFNQSTSGSVVAGSSATLSMIINQSTSGGVQIAGTAAPSLIINQSTSGGATTSGGALIDIPLPVACHCNTYEEPTSGGFEFGGSATIVDNIITGGFKVGGEVTVLTSGTAYEDFACVHPLNEDGDGTIGEFLDHTTHVLHGTGGLLPDGTNDETSVPIQTEGIGCQYAQALDGRSYIGTDPDCLISTQPFSISCWAKIETFGQARTFFSRGFDSGDDSKWICSLGHTFLNQINFTVQTVNNGVYTINTVQGTTILERDINYHFAATFLPGESINVYVNGVLANTRAITDVETPPNDTGNYIARWHLKSNPVGTIQEVRLSGVVRSADWFKAEHDNFCGSFYSISEEENTVYA